MGDFFQIQLHGTSILVTSFLRSRYKKSLQKHRGAP